VPPAVPILPMMASTMSLAVMPGDLALTCTSMFLAFLASRVWVAITCSTSEVPMPGQRAERAVGGGVAVAADHGHAGQGGAVFGADDVHDALALVHEGEEGRGAEFWMLLSSVVICSLLIGSVMPS
jgi:hypothetical protein